MKTYLRCNKKTKYHKMGKNQVQLLEKQGNRELCGKTKKIAVQY